MTAKSVLKIADDLSLPLDAVTQTFAILAKRGVGKTYALLVMAEEMLKANQRIVIADPVGVCWGLRASADGRGPGQPIVIFGGEHADVPLEPTGGALVADLVVDEPSLPGIVLDLSLLRKAEQVRFMADFAATLYRRNRQPLHLFLDEADEFAPQKPGKDQLKMLGAIEDLVRRGRARGLGITMATQRSAVLNKNVLTQIEVLVAMRTPSPQDQAAIDGWIQVHGTPAQRKELMASLASLPIGTAWLWSPGWLDLFQRIKIRKRLTFDSSATPKMGEQKRSPKNLAAVDLGKLREKMTATIERAKFEDPKQLRAEIAKLKKELAAKPAPAAAIMKPAIGTTTTVDRLVVKKSDVEKITRLVNKIGEGPLKSLNLIGNQISKASADLVAALAQAAVVETPRRTTVEIPHFSPPPAKPPANAAPRAGLISRPPNKLVQGANGQPMLNLGERRILTAIAQHAGGVAREQLTVLTGYKRSSRDTYLQRIRAAGLIDDGPTITVMPAGVDALGDQYEPLPTGDRLREHWLGKLSGGELRLLEAVIEAYPQPVSRDFLCAATGYQRSSRDTYLQRLAARRLVVTSRDGVTAAAELFG